MAKVTPNKVPLTLGPELAEWFDTLKIPDGERSKFIQRALLDKKESGTVVPSATDMAAVTTVFQPRQANTVLIPEGSMESDSFTAIWPDLSYLRSCVGTLIDRLALGRSSTVLVPKMSMVHRGRIKLAAVHRAAKKKPSIDLIEPKKWKADETAPCISVFESDRPLPNLLFSMDGLVYTRFLDFDDYWFAAKIQTEKPNFLTTAIQMHTRKLLNDAAKYRKPTMFVARPLTPP